MDTEESIRDTTEESIRDTTEESVRDAAVDPNVKQADSKEFKQADSKEFLTKTSEEATEDAPLQPGQIRLEDGTILDSVDKIEPVTRRELWSWIAYDFANSVYSTVGITLFIPLLLDTLAFNGGFDPLTGGPCVAANQTAGIEQSCRVTLPTGITLDNTAYTLYMISISVGLQAAFFVSVSSIADFGPLRKYFLLFFAAVGSALTILFISTGNDLWLYAGLLTIFSNLCFGVSIVFYNAFLPILAASDPKLIEARKEGETDVAVLSHMSQDISSRISTHGFAAGYVSGTVLLAACLGLIFAFDGTLGMQLALLLTGIWWAAFTIPFLLFVKKRPGPPFPVKWYWLPLLSWQRLYYVIRALPKLPYTFLYLLCYFIFSDGYNTITSVAILFGKRELNMDTLELGIIAVITPLCAGIGNYFYYFIQKKLKIGPKPVLMFILAMIALVPLYGVLGFADIGFGLKNKWEMYMLAVFFGLHLGAAQSYARVVMSELIPPQHESQFFGLYEITDKGSSFIGTAIIAAITDSNGELRYGMVYLAFAMLIPVPVLFFVRMVRGKEMAEKIKLHI